MKYIVHGGKGTIGGNCIELVSSSGRLVLDMGVPVNADSPDSIDLPPIKGLTSPADDLFGVLVSHPHFDHFGLLYKVGENVPVYMGKAAAAIIEAADPYMPFDKPRNIIGKFENREQFNLGPFSITPFLVDHSAYDSYAFLIEAEGSRYFYTGDIRAHGRKAALSRKLLSDPPPDIDVLFTEGTRLHDNGEEDSHGVFSEYDVEKAMADEFRRAKGMVLVACSAQNIDRIVSVCRACIRSGRQLIVDLYTHAVLKATGNPKIPNAKSDLLKLFLPEWQKRMIRKSRNFDYIDNLKEHRMYWNHLSDEAPRSVLIFRNSMIQDLEHAGCLKGASAVWSMWSGYLGSEYYSGKRFKEFCSRNGISWRIVHSSGHAPGKFIRELKNSIDAKETVLIHSEKTSI